MYFFLPRKQGKIRNKVFGNRQKTGIEFILWFDILSLSLTLKFYFFHSSNGNMSSKILR